MDTIQTAELRLENSQLGVDNAKLQKEIDDLRAQLDEKNKVITRLEREITTRIAINEDLRKINTWHEDRLDQVARFIANKKTPSANDVTLNIEGKPEEVVATLGTVRLTHFHV